VLPNSWSASSPVRLQKLRFWWNLLAAAVAVNYPKWNSLQQQQLQQAVWGAGGAGGGGGGSERSKQTADRKLRERNWGKEDCVATEAGCGEVSKQKQNSAKTEQNKQNSKKNKQNKQKLNKTKLSKTQQNIIIIIIIINLSLAKEDWAAPNSHTAYFLWAAKCGF
jgi:hypothetical protein